MILRDTFCEDECTYNIFNAFSNLVKFKEYLSPFVLTQKINILIEYELAIEITQKCYIWILITFRKRTRFNSVKVYKNKTLFDKTCELPSTCVNLQFG